MLMQQQQQQPRGLGGIHSLQKEITSPPFKEAATSSAHLGDKQMLEDITTYLQRNVQLMKASFFDEELARQLVPDESTSTDAIIDQYMDISNPPSPEMIQEIVPVKKAHDVRLFQVNGFYGRCRYSVTKC